jgi:tRNA A-37 threonylcarbamoyl transferase component Bud32/Tol biopolymer transport system component
VIGAESPLPAGSRLGPYEIVALVGSGGMAEVYRAHDTRLNRVVAVKMLGANVADTPQRRQRFEREARAVSALSHPNICVLFDIGEDQGRPFLVMEYVAGETLAQRLRRGAIPVPEALRLAILIADALDHAHRQGIVHRDLKPANVMLTSGGPKLVDFGLAKLREADSASGDATDETESLTADGVLLGTLPYMAPEQVEAKQADARSDIFAFGALLYEMITARRAFDAPSKAGLIVSILEHDPPPMAESAQIASLGDGGPPASLLEHVVARCLAKQPDDRWQTAADLKRELRWIADRVAMPTAVPRAASRANTIVATLAVALIAVTIVLTGFGTHQPVPATPPAVVTFPLTLAPGTALVSGPAAPQMAVSPDGQWITYTAGTSAVSSQLWLWRMSDAQLKPLEHTDGADYPFWSPDSQSIGFFASGRLKIIRLDDKAPIDLTAAAVGDSGAWGADDTILFAPTQTSALMQVSTRTHKLKAATRLDEANNERRHVWPSFLPDGRHFVYYVQNADSTLTGIALATVDTVADQSRLILTAADARAAYAHGSIIYGREGTLFSQPFDTVHEVFTGKAEPIVTNVARNKKNGRMAFSASDSILVYRTGTDAGMTASRLEWRDRRGQAIGKQLGEPALYGAIALSPDGQSVAVGRGDPSEVVLFEGPTGLRQFLTEGTSGVPVWSPGGDAIVAAQTSGSFVRKDVRSGNEATLFRDPRGPFLTSLSPDGRTVLYGVPNSVTNWDIWERTLGNTVSRPYLATPFTEGDAKFSPDGHWVAYVSDETSRREVWVGAYPAPEPKYKISNGGGYMPLWRADGRALYYLDRTSQLVEVEVTTGPTSFKQGAVHLLFQGDVNQGLAQHFTSQYAVSPDGQRFLFKRLVQPESPITVMLNWPSATVR